MNAYSRRDLLKTGFAAAAASCLPGVSSRVLADAPSGNASLARKIVTDARLDHVTSMAHRLLSAGLSAGAGYPQVWIRDTNTFIETALKVNKPGLLRSALINFFKLQGPTGDIVDGYVADSQGREQAYRVSPLMPGYAAHKNTVETDQETSLVLAVCKYVRVTGDDRILDEPVAGRTVRIRLSQALDYVATERFDSRYGLVWGGTRMDWGDVQPETRFGTRVNDMTHRALTVYDSALFVSAMQGFIELPHIQSAEMDRWSKTIASVVQNIRKYLWDSRLQKFIPHIYLAGSPFPAEFDEASRYYHGGTTVAVEAGVLSRNEVRTSLTKMRENVALARAGSIGLTVFPPYPDGYFKDPIMTKPYTYQNGGDWDWFGGRTIQQLIRYELVEDAYAELSPMLDRVIRAGDFYEWWSPDNEPRGSAGFRGAAGVLAKAIDMLQGWAKNQLPSAG